MIKFNGKEYRNLEEQVLENTQAIKEIHDIGLLLAQLGIKVVGQVDTAAELPDPAEYYADDRENHYGDAFAVGTQTPYYFYLFTRPFEGETDPKWFSIGQFPLKGPQGEQGEAGQGADFDSAQFVSSGFNEPNITGTLLLKSGTDTTNIPMTVTRPIKDGTGISISTDAAGVTAPSIYLFDHEIKMTENHQVDSLDQEGWDVVFHVISTSSTEIASFSDLCDLFADTQTPSAGHVNMFFPASGIKYSSPYVAARYSNTFPTSVMIDAVKKTLSISGISIVPGNYDSPVSEAYETKTAVEASLMGFTDLHVVKFPHVVQTN